MSHCYHQASLRGCWLFKSLYSFNGKLELYLLIPSQIESPYFNLEVSKLTISSPVSDTLYCIYDKSIKEVFEYVVRTGSIDYPKEERFKRS